MPTEKNLLCESRISANASITLRYVQPTGSVPLQFEFKSLLPVVRFIAFCISLFALKSKKGE